MDATFVRKDFYSEPPASGAGVEEWTNWAAKDDRKAAAAKAQYTKSFNQQECPSWLVGETVVTKQNGVHTQSTLVGFTGSADAGDCQAEVAVQPGQEHHIALVDMEAHRNRRGGSKSGKSARRRKNRKLRK